MSARFWVATSVSLAGCTLAESSVEESSPLEGVFVLRGPHFRGARSPSVLGIVFVLATSPLVIGLVGPSGAGGVLVFT